MRLHKDVCDDYNDEKRANGGRFTTEPDWVMSNARWKPPRVMPLSGDVRNTAICTALTDYGYSIKPGLIIYELWRRVKCREDELAVPLAVERLDWDTTYDGILPSMNELPSKIGTYDPSEP